jgi:hypothetical protein
MRLSDSSSENNINSWLILYVACSLSPPFQQSSESSLDDQSVEVAIVICFFDDSLFHKAMLSSSSEISSHCRGVLQAGHLEFVKEAPASAAHAKHLESAQRWRIQWAFKHPGRDVWWLERLSQSLLQLKRTRLLQFLLTRFVVLRWSSKLDERSRQTQWHQHWRWDRRGVVRCVIRLYVINCTVAMATNHHLTWQRSFMKYFQFFCSPKCLITLCRLVLEFYGVRKVALRRKFRKMIRRIKSIPIGIHQLPSLLTILHLNIV